MSLSDLIIFLQTLAEEDKKRVTFNIDESILRVFYKGVSIFSAGDEEFITEFFQSFGIEL